ncbi:MAG: class I SAM-dependent methyltransferase [Rickettsiales bacterium]|nr:class I SAM-dependent methyltransferase [Rickettsiales bacterium]
MVNGKASMTAIICAYGRAYHAMNDEPKIFHDYLAQDMLTEEELIGIPMHMTNGFNFFKSEETHLHNSQEALEWVMQTQIAPTPLARSRYTEDILEQAIKLGVQQYVILGAGFDTFAFRRPELLDNIKVYEVDHPDTQNLKIERIENNHWDMNKSHKFIPVDFLKDDFSVEIMKSDFNPEKLTLFSWLGVTYYLTKEEMLKTLNGIMKIAAKGSTVVFDYPDENIFNNEKNSIRVQKMVELAKESGESMKIGYDYLSLEKYLKKVGLLIYEHLTPLEIPK